MWTSFSKIFVSSWEAREEEEAGNQGWNAGSVYPELSRNVFTVRRTGVIDSIRKDSREYSFHGVVGFPSISSSPFAYIRRNKSPDHFFRYLRWNEAEARLETGAVRFRAVGASDSVWGGNKAKVKKDLCLLRNCFAQRFKTSFSK